MIALCGTLRSGKDTVAEYLSSKYEYTRFAFGDELKRYAHELFGETDGKQRELYQWFGQVMRERDPNIWIRKCFDAMDLAEINMPSKYDVDFRAVVSDLRQPNEFSALKAAGYVIIRVTAPEGIRINRAVESGDRFNYADLRHDTESHVTGFEVDYEIENNGSLTDLYTQVDEIMTQIHRKGAA
ncbi:AAA family ATPase [Paenibacillus terrigena]|uniref:deoxynucleotide monophosphate kinase family protein n=1 Tax=Paenibacillus terrigena TaxID=369333 RepID=UPI000364D93E|nr:AAA family ATPase [Paenibacillus terrigena]